MSSIKPYDSSDLDDEVVEGLRKAFRKIRPIYPIVVAGDGEILDGRHRMTAAPGTYQTYKVTMKEVVSNKDKLLWKLHLNYRRQVTNQERKKQVTELAEILTKEGVKREDMTSTLASLVPFSLQYVRELLPDEYKMTEFAHKEEEKPVSRTEVYIKEPQAKPASNEPATVGEPFKDTWEHRQAMMSQPVSRMEQEAITELIAEGQPIETSMTYPVLSTTPDAQGTKQFSKVVFYIDGEAVHAGREDRDERLRELLAKRYGFRVVSIRYKSYSQAAKEEVKAKIRENLQV